MTSNDWKYRELLSNINQPELFGESPLIINNNFIPADKPSITFH